MRETRNWYGRKVFVMEDTQNKPKTFFEREEEATFLFFSAWMRWTLLPTAATMALYLAVPVEPMFGHPWNAFWMAGVVFLLTNIPNYAILLVRVAALWFVRAGRE